ncbi:MAG: response regulator transcription factor [Caldilineales bacterium]
MRVLVVEDEARMAALIRQGLEEDGYAVDVVGNGGEVYDWVRIYTYDLILLDVMLPGMNGIEVCRLLRGRGVVVPVLMLTARHTVANRVEGLDSGADDYLVKPFAIHELLARVRALTRRHAPQRTVDLRVGDLTLDTVSKRARRGERTVELSAKEYAILETLMRHQGQVLSQAQIIEHVWNADFDAQSKLVEVYIHALRRKIDDNEDLKLIQTVRGLGYRMSADAVNA